MLKLSVLLICIHCTIHCFSQSPRLMLPVGHSYGVYNARFISDNQYVVTDGFLWDAATGLLLKKYTGVTTFSTANNKMATANRDTIFIWDLTTDSLIRQYKTGMYISSLQFCTDNITLVARSSDSVKLINIITGQFSKAFKGGSAYSISNDQQFLLMHDNDPRKKPILWHTTTATILADFSTIESLPDGYVPNSVNAIFTQDNTKMLVNTRYAKGKITKDGYTLKSEGGYSNIAIWDAKAGKRLYELKVQHDYIDEIKFSYDGKTIIGVEKDRLLRIWNSADGTLLKSIKTAYAIKTIASHPDKNIICIGFSNGTVSAYDLSSATEIRSFKAHEAGINIIGFNNDGTKMITGSDDRTARIWNTNNDQLITQLRSRCNLIKGIFSSPDRNYLGIVDSVGAVSHISLWSILNATKDGNLWVKQPEEFSFNYIEPPGTFLPAWGGRFRLNTRFHGQQVLWEGDGIRQRTFTSIGFTSVAGNGYFIDVNGRYNVLFVDSTDYLVFDNDGRYDGTDAARKLLYFVQGTQILELEQVKELLWVPGLATRLNKGETVFAPKLSEIDFRNNAPVI